MYSGYVIEGGEFTGCEVVVPVSTCFELITLIVLTDVLDDGLLADCVSVTCRTQNGKKVM